MYEFLYISFLVFSSILHFFGEIVSLIVDDYHNERLYYFEFAIYELLQLITEDNLFLLEAYCLEKQCVAKFYYYFH